IPRATDTMRTTAGPRRSSSRSGPSRWRAGTRSATAARSSITASQSATRARGVRSCAMTSRWPAPRRSATRAGRGRTERCATPSCPASIRWSTRDWQKGHWAWASASRTHPARAARRSCTCSEWRAAAPGCQLAGFDRGWQDRMGIGYRDILYPPTGERLTRTSFQRLRRTGGVVVFFIIPDSIVRLALADPLVMVASDGISAHGHPRLAGTHARVLGRYARDSGALSLMDAVRKMTLMPAQRLEQTVPAMHAKGRVQAGADADLTVFDRGKVLDRATYERPAQFSDGIVHVLVNGTFVVRNGASVAQQYTCRAVRTTPYAIEWSV